MPAHRGHLKLPAYGRDLKRQRDRGHHPERVWIIVGDDWQRLPGNAPYLCVKADYQVGMYDWSILAGVPAHVVERDDVDATRLAAEIAVWAAPVMVHWRSPEDDIGMRVGQALVEDIRAIAYCQRQPVQGVMTWPAWWPELLRQDYEARRAIYLRALREDAAGRFGDLVPMDNKRDAG